MLGGRKAFDYKIVFACVRLQLFRKQTETRSYPANQGGSQDYMYVSLITFEQY